MKSVRRVVKIWKSVKRRTPRWPKFIDRQRSSIPARLLHNVQAATFRFEYAGHPCIKNPFDLSLYSMLIARERPRTIIEIGSAFGGSALWFAAQTRGLGLGATVFSVDINPVTDVSDPNVVFIEGDAHRLDESDLPQFLSNAPRPWLVVEDGPHTYEGCIAVLGFFKDKMERGEYIIIEDGILKDLNFWELRNGPNRAIKAFVRENLTTYEIDRFYCDFYGHNVTWNTNGYLRRL